MTTLSPPPRHVAIIMDGNGRWAQQRGKPRAYGHKVGAERVKAVLERAGELGIEIVTLYAFSEENFERPSTEIAVLMELFTLHLMREREDLMRRNVRFRSIGARRTLPRRLRKTIELVEGDTAGNTGVTINLALAYGGRSEIINAARSLCQQVGRGELKADEITAEAFSDELYTRGMPDPDLMIRTSGERRISNFLLWQAAETVLDFTPVLWPDYAVSHLEASVRRYQERHPSCSSTPTTT